MGSAAGSPWARVELRRARDLLLAPIPMLLANAVLLALAWYAALGR
jgi:hypothetical protein